MEYVNVYEVTRHYGGAEEGGWWFDWWECVEIVPINKERLSDSQIDELFTSLRNDYGEGEGNISSILGGYEIHILLENERCESQTLCKPKWE